MVALAWVVLWVVLWAWELLPAGDSNTRPKLLALITRRGIADTENHAGIRGCDVMSCDVM